ncbi:MAG: hypothetical protein HKO07_08645, partial [Pseudomonadales bacterium]|nr:hypothetical protein [Pseudomonadales bacterium]
SNDLDLGTDELGVGNYNIASDYETVSDTLQFAVAGCTPGDCFATSATTTPGSGSAIVTADISPAAAYTDPTLNFGATTLLPWGANSFVGAGSIALAGVGTPLATLQEYGLAALQFTDTLSDIADLNGVYGFVDMNVSYSGGASTDNALVTTQSRVFDATFDGAGNISTSGAMSQFDASVGTTDGSVTYDNTALGAGTYNFDINNSGATELLFAGGTLNGIADAAGELVAISGGNQRGYAVKLGSATVADLVNEGPYSLEGLVINAERGQITAGSLEGATISFTDQGSGDIKATLNLTSEAGRGVSTFDASDNALPTVGTIGGPGGTHNSEVFTMDANGRFSTIGFGSGTATKRFDIEGFYVPGRGLLLRYVESAIESSGGASSSIVFYCGPAAGQTFVNPNTGAEVMPQPTGNFVCGFVEQGSAGSGTRVSDLARVGAPNPQILSVIEGQTDTVISGPDGFGQGIVWGAPQ